MDNELVTRLCMLFATYSYWPVKLHPLIDYVKKNNDLKLIYHPKNKGYGDKYPLKTLSKVLSHNTCFACFCLFFYLFYKL